MSDRKSKKKQERFEKLPHSLLTKDNRSFKLENFFFSKSNCIFRSTNSELFSFISWLIGNLSLFMESEKSSDCFFSILFIETANGVYQKMINDIYVEKSALFF